LVPLHALLDNNIPFRHGAGLIVDIPINPRRMHDFFNDIIALTVEIMFNIFLINYPFFYSLKGRWLNQPP
jgi:hypothetical protein